MIFDITMQEALDKWSQWLAYRKDTDTYNTCVFVDTTNDVGLLPKSDVICVFSNKTGDLIAFTERIEKKDYNALQRFLIEHRGKRICKRCPYDYEGFMNDRGEFIEFQFYKRWWYDIARNVGNLANMHFTEPYSESGKDT